MRNDGVPHPSECRLLVGSDDDRVADSVLSSCSAQGYLTQRTRTVAEFTRALDPHRIDLALIDLPLLGTDPGAAIDAILTRPEAPPVVLMAGEDRRAEVFGLVERGLHDIVGRPPHPAELRLRVDRVVEARDLGDHLASLEDAITERSLRSYTDRTLVARSPAMAELARTIQRVAGMRTTVLIRGESGVGKELVARALHFRSPRREGPFITLNCAALPPHLIESELFGHERGAFTGAVNRRAGKFELAHRGTLFLDEVGETDLMTQAKLLRVIEQREFMRVGGSRPLRVDVRLVAATNADLERLVREGRFREDLYYRLSVVNLAVPPLRDRKDDIPELVQTFLSQICRANHLRPRSLTPTAIEALMRYSWPGNVRELMNTLEAVVVATPQETIDVEHLPANLQHDLPALQYRPHALAGRTLRDIEAEAIRVTLHAVGGSRTRAAEILGIGVRTLRRRIRELGLDRDLPPRPGRPRVERRGRS